MKLNNLTIILLSSIFFIIVLFANSVFILDKSQQAIVLQFGKSQKQYKDPGLKFKIPFIQEVFFYDTRVLDFDLDPVLVTTLDQKRLVVDSYTRYRISNPLLFFQTVQPSDENGARMRMEGIISGCLRNVLGKENLRTMLSSNRSNIMKKVEQDVANVCKNLGIEIIDVRIIRTDLPSENKKAVLDRMNSDLQRFAKENRAKGVEFAEKIKASADREKTYILAEATKQAQIIKAEAEVEAINILNTAYSKDVSFYYFFRWLETYKTSFSKNLNIVIGKDSPLLKVLQNYSQIMIK